MSVEIELQKLQTNLSNCYTTCQSKGARIPTNRDFNSLANTISTITGKGVIEPISITPTKEEQIIEAGKDIDGYSPITVSGVAVGGIETTTFSFDSNNYQVSDGKIKANSFLNTNYNVSITAEQWAKELIIQLHIKTPTSFNNQNQWIMGTNTGSWNTGIGVTINKDNGNKFWFMLGQTDTSLALEFNSVTVAQTNTEYWLKLYKSENIDSSCNISFQISTDGINWITEDSKTITNISSNFTTTGNIRLFNGYFGDANNQFYGDIYLNDIFISIDNEKVWYLIKPELASPFVEDAKYGATISSFIGNIDSNGVLQAPKKPINLVFNGVEDLGDFALTYRFFTPNSRNKYLINSVSFPNLKKITGESALQYAFPYSNIESFSADLVTEASGYDCMGNALQISTKLKTFSMKSLVSIGRYAFNFICWSCSELETVDLSNLKTISNYGMNGAFDGCSKLTSVRLDSLESIDERGLSHCFGNCSSLTTLSFPALTSQSFGSYTDQFNEMLRYVTGCTVHFPSNLQSVIGDWEDVQNGFSGTNTTVLFDLPATE